METFTSIVKTIWITDDDPDDLDFFQDALREIYPSAELTLISNGEELLEKLSCLPAPDLLFLDISMPYKGGHDCVKEIRSKNQLRSLPIVIYSSSPNPLDITYSYGFGANLYVRKPTKYSDIVLLLRKVLQLDWKNPQEITNNMFVGGNYVPFTAL
jgi:CheY-like chemotaxis protein